MCTNPLVSVVIPTYNGEKFIEKCIESVLSQTYINIEIVVVDDGSFDNTISIVKEFCNKYPENIKLVIQENSDVSKARNTGVDNSNGELIAFLDQDDFFESSKIQKQVSLFENIDNIDLIFCDIIKIFANGKHHHAKDKFELAKKLDDNNLFIMLSMKNVIMPSAVMVKKESFLRAGRFDTSFTTCGDYEMWLRMAGMGMKFRFLQEPLTFYRLHGNNSSSKHKIMHLDRLKAINSVFTMPFLSDRDRSYFDKSVARAYLEGANTYYSKKDYCEYMNLIKIAIGFDKALINFKIIRRFLSCLIISKISSPTSYFRSRTTNTKLN